MMAEKTILRITHAALVVWLVLGLLGVAAVQASNIDPTNKWAWGTNIGWINFRPTHAGVTVYEDHLEGYAWAENVGWIRLGSYTGGGSYTYANSTKDDYGVNRDPSGNLSGYAWGTNVGWINFNPTHGGVNIDPITGSFTGYAWGENVGWISFKNTGPIAYNVVATTVIAVTKGDVNGDGTIDLLDVRLCLQIAQGVLVGTPTQRSAADVDRDGAVDETDAQILSEYVIGMRSALP
jgi:hypothetical protein